MRYAITKVETAEEYGFNTEKFRKSVDGLKCLWHYEDAKIVVTDIDTNENFTVLNKADTEAMLKGSEWTIEEEEI